MQRFSLSFLALCLFVAALAAALPAQNKRGFGDEAFDMADEFMNDPAFQTGGVGQATVITPTNGPKPTPAPASSSSPAKAHAPIATSSPGSSSHSSTPTPTSSTPVSATTAAFTSTGPDATVTPSDKKDQESFLNELPIVGDAMRMLGVGA